MSGEGYYAQARGAADVVLTLVGAGAQGSSYAEGRDANSTIAVTSTGALGVDVRADARSAAHITAPGQASAVITIDAGTGSAAVRANATALSDSSGNSSPVTAVLDIRASGNIDGISTARSGDAYNIEPFAGSSAGTARASASGIGHGSRSVTLEAVAVAGSIAVGTPWSAPGAAANATASGQSGLGPVTVTAQAQAGRGKLNPGADTHYGAGAAAARAVNTAYQGRGKALASVTGGEISALAQAQGLDRRGATVRVTAGTKGSTVGNEYGDLTGSAELSGTALATNYLPSSTTALAELPAGVAVVSHVAAAPDLAPVGGIGAGGIGTLAGAGMQMFGASYAMPNQVTWLDASGQFEFAASGGEHLLIDLLSASSVNSFSTLELSITNHGVALFSQTFLSAGEASLFFNGQVLDLGVIGAGMQDVIVSSRYGYNSASAFAFNYLVGTGAAVSAVPEPATWLMLMLGLGVMVGSARARGRA